MNKNIKRDGDTSTKLFDNRSLQTDYATLISILKPGMRVLDVGCGTGAISKDIAAIVGLQGSITGIDNTAHFIESGKETYKAVKNLELIHADVFEFDTPEKFDLVVSARVLQWLNNPVEALIRFKHFLKPGGQISVLDYNHELLSWTPSPPESMLQFYATFLRWRADAGMNNHIAEDLSNYFAESGLKNIQTFNADEVYTKGQDNFIPRVGIWSKVAVSTQMVEEGYISNDDRLKAIEDYDNWVNNEAESMTMVLREVRGSL
jgi:ubiquinone/menaquinone biosynthesis C-methylase UbiE